MKILIIGSTGMLGHVVTKHFENQGYQVFKTTRREEGSLYFDPMIDIRKIETIIENIKPEAIINCIGILNKEADENKSKAILINSYLPHYLDELSEKYNYKFVHISTDCVFNGLQGDYNETSFKDAMTFYGKTKALGEIENNRSITLRTSIIGPDPNPNGIGLFGWFMRETGEVKGYKKAIWTGVTTIELAKQIEVAIKHKLTGLYHVVNAEKISKYDLLILFKNTFDKEINILPDDEYISDKSLVVTKDFKFDIPSYTEMIEEMKLWIIENEEIYKGLYLKKGRK